MNTLELGRLGLTVVLGAALVAGCNKDKDTDTDTDSGSDSSIDTQDTSPPDGPTGPNAFTISLESPIKDGIADTTVVQGQALPGIFYFSLEDVEISGNSITDSETKCIAIIDVPVGSGTYAAAGDTDDTDAASGLATWLDANGAAYGYEFARPTTIQILNIDDGGDCDLDADLWGANPLDTMWPGTSAIRVGFTAALPADLKADIQAQDATLLNRITGGRILDPGGDVNDSVITQAVTNDTAQTTIEVDDMLDNKGMLVDGYFVVSSLLYQVLDAN